MSYNNNPRQKIPKSEPGIEPGINWSVDNDITALPNDGECNIIYKYKQISIICNRKTALL